MRKILIAAFSLVPALAFAEIPPTGTMQKQSSLNMPDKAQLLGTAEATELREFPELQKGQTGKTTPTEKMVGVTATDRVYQSDRSYDATVKFFDGQIKSGFQMIAKTTTPTATGWTVRSTDGMMINLIVRNTKPQATIETIEAMGASATTPEPQKGMNTPPPAMPAPNMPSRQNPSTNY
jgi:hypothetical protein